MCLSVGYFHERASVCVCVCVTVLGEGSRVNSHCPVLSATVARYTGLFGQLPCLSVCLGDAG